MEAKIDFPEEDIPENVIVNIKSKVENIEIEIKKILDDNKVGEKIRTGFKIAIVGPPNSGKLQFHTPQTPSWTNGTIMPRVSEDNIFNCDSFGFEVERGDIFIFPSQTLHSVEKNLSNMDRYMIAFNYFLEGTIGNQTGEISIKVS